MKKITLVFLVHIFIIMSIVPVYSDVDKDSIFDGARYPASELDLKLSEIQNRWWVMFVISPTADIKKEHPLISKARVSIQLNYFGDRIHATGWILDTNGFISLSTNERKQLVRDILEHISSFLSGIIVSEARIVDKNTGMPTGQPFNKKHIMLNLITSGVINNDKGENIRLFLPLFEVGGGQAGYKDGQYVYSEDYYLHLTVKDGRAKAGDASKFIIEKEK